VCVRLARDLRAASIAVDVAYGERGLKGSMKAADRSQAPLVVIIGDDEVAAGTVTLKDMSAGSQQTFASKDAIDAVTKQLARVKGNK